MIWTRVPALQASEESLASFAEQYAVAATSVTKDSACLDLERVEAEAARLMASGVEQSSQESSEGTSDEETSDEETSDEESSEDESSEEESSTCEEDDAHDGGDVAEAVQAKDGTVPESLSTEPVCKPDTFASPVAPATADVESTVGEPGTLLVTEGGRVNISSSRSGGGGEGASLGATSTTTGVDIDHNSRSRAVETSADLLQLETLSSKGRAAETGASSTLASRLAMLSLEKQPIPPVPGSGIVALGGADTLLPPPLSSKAAGNDGSGTGSDGGRAEGAQQGALIEEL